jgi:hypothetical protein
MRKGLLALLLLTAAGAARAEEPSTAPFAWRTEGNTAFKPGESLLYVIKYGFISGGHASLEVRSTETVRGRAAYHIVSEARTNSALDVVFKVRDLNESWMDVQSLCSHKYHQVMNEGRYHREVESRFDHPNRTFAYWKRTRKGEGTKQGAIPPFVHDVLTSLYYIRTKPLVVGQDLVMDVNSGAETWPLIVKVKKIEKIKVPAGRFECYRVEPLISGEGLFMQTGNLEVWITTDGSRLPVLMRSKVMVGAFTAELLEKEFESTEPRGLYSDD